MHVHIAQVNAVLFNDTAVSITVPGSDGALTILPHHEPFITTLGKGNILVKKADNQQEFSIEKGVLEVSNNEVNVLV